MAVERKNLETGAWEIMYGPNRWVDWKKPTEMVNARICIPMEESGLLPAVITKPMTEEAKLQ